MEKRNINNAKLGVFVIIGIVLLVVSLYLIGKNQNLFGARFLLKARFNNVNGLMPGNNVRFSGIQCGTVRDIEIINDTTIEVTMLINSRTSRYIRQNATAAIGNEGLMGNKVINIVPGIANAPLVSDGDMLLPAMKEDLDDMLSTLAYTNDNASQISFQLRQVAEKLNTSPALWQILNDTTIPVNLRETFSNLQNASVRIDQAARSADELLRNVRTGRGVAGTLLSNDEAGKNIAQAIDHIRITSQRADGLVLQLDSLVKEIRGDVNNGQGIVRTLLKDPELVKQLNASVDNIEKGTAAFNDDMEALKHNFLLRGYFKKQARKNLQQPE